MPGARVAGRRGRLPVKPAAKRLRIGYLSAYLTTSLPVPVYPVDVSAGITDWGMLGNGPDPAAQGHSVGVNDAVFAGLQHYRMAKSAASGELGRQETTDELVAEYLAYTKGTDVGASIADVLLYWYSSSRIIAFAAVDHANPGEIDAVMAAFHGVYVGVNLTEDADRLFEQDRPWTTNDGQRPNPDDGHCLVKVAADGLEFDTWVTWGAVQKSTRHWTSACVEEAWVVITEEDAAGLPVDLAALRADIDVLVGNESAAESPVTASTSQSAEGPVPRSPEPLSPSPGPVVDDDVRFTVYRPQVLYPDEWAQMLVYAHKTDPVVEPGRGPVDPIERVEAQARAHFGGAPPSPIAADARQELARGALLRIVPDLPGIRCNPANAEVEWWEPVHEVVFRLLAPPELAGTTVRGAVRILLGPLILGEVFIAIRVAAAGPITELPLTAESVRRYRKIFASYSHLDSAIVAAFGEVVDTLGDRFLQDVRILRAGERWNERLRELIEEADVFQLFWSSHSMRSPQCQDEWEYALGLRRPSFILPVYWEDPLPEDLGHELPPSGLRELHFRKLELLAPDSAGPIPAGAVTPGQPRAQPGDYAPGNGAHVGSIHQAPPQRPRRTRRLLAAAAAAAVVAGGAVSTALLSSSGGLPSGVQPPPPTASSSPSPTASHGPGRFPTSRLRPGYCLAGQNLPLHTPHRWPRTVYVVPCGHPHVAEVYYSSNYWPADLAYPGERVKLRLAARKCSEVFRSYAGISYSQSMFAERSISPGRSEWVSGDRQLICVAYKPTKKYPAGAPLHASIRRSST
jgi:TIR domain/Septum formation